MILFIALVLIVATVVMLLKQNKPGTIICAVLLIVLAIMRPFVSTSPADRVAKFDKQNKSVMTQVFVERLVERHPEKRIALVVGPEVEGLDQKRKERHSIEGVLTKAFQKHGVEPLIVPLPLMKGMQKKLDQSQNSDGELDFSPEMAYYTALMHDLVQYSAKDINALLLSLKDKADVVVWTLDLSMMIEAKKLLPRGKGPDLVLLKVNVDDIDQAFRSTVLDMHLNFRPDASWEVDYEWPKNLDEAFDARYVITTRDQP